VGVLLCAASAQAAIPNTFGLAFGNNNPSPTLNAMNGGLGEGAVLCNSWQNGTVAANAGPYGTVTDGLQSVSFYNQSRLNGAQSYYNGTRDPVPGTQILKGAAKQHYYGQNWKIVGLDTLGWTGVDIYVYGLNGGGYIVDTNPGWDQPTSGAANGTVVTNGGWQTITAWNLAATSYTQGANYFKFSNITPEAALWLNLQQSDFSAFQIVRAEIPCITVTGTPGTPADWATATTWDINPLTPNATNTAYVRHTVNVAAASGPQAVAGMKLDDPNSDLRIESGASLTAGTTSVSNGSLLATGALNATTLNVSGGAATIPAGSTSTIGTLTASGGTTSVAGGTVTTLNSSATGTAVSGGSVTAANISGGTASLSGGTIGTVTASGGTTTLGTSVTNLNVGGTAVVNGAAGMAATTATLTGGTVNTSGNYMAIGNKITMTSGRSITVTGAASVDLKGADLGAGTISNMKLNGGTVAISGVGSTVSVIDKSTAALSANGNINVTGGDMLAVAVSTYGNSPNPAGWTMTYNGTTMTPAVSQMSAATTTVTTAIFYLPTPAVGNLPLVFTGTPTVFTMEYATLSGVTAAGLLTGSIDVGSGTTASVAVGGIASASAAFVSQGLRQGSASGATVSATSGTALSLPLGTNGNIQGEAGVITGLSAGSNTFSGIGAGYTGTRHPLAVAVFGATVDPATVPISLSSTTVELNALASTLDIGAASSASFADLVLASGITTPSYLTVQGTNATAVTNLSNYFDVTAPNAALVSIDSSGTSGPNSWVKLLVGFHPGDVNGDGQVSLLDYNVIKANFGNTYESGNHWTDGDVNGDLQVGLLDFNIVKAHFGHTSGDVGVTAVPEPATMSLLALAGLAALRRKR